MGRHSEQQRRAIERAMDEAVKLGKKIVFEPAVGMSFNSEQEAYEFYNVRHIASENPPLSNVGTPPNPTGEPSVAHKEPCNIPQLETLQGHSVLLY